MKIIKESTQDSIEIFKDFTWRNFEKKRTEVQSSNVIDICDITCKYDGTIIILDDDEEPDNDGEDETESENTTNEDQSDSGNEQLTILDASLSLSKLSFNRTLRSNSTRIISEVIQQNSTNTTYREYLDKQLDAICDNVLSNANNELPDSIVSNVDQVIIEPSKDSTCPTCQRTFKGIRGLKCHYSAKSTTCKNIFV